uniref:Activating signal cointegrator 1 complex subunit 3 n=1 Tax=Oncorhynchus mykiss TaxID=8022 RepID=A0A8K9XG39_ONCMY
MYELEKSNLQRCSEYVVHILRPSYVKGFMTTYLRPEVAERILSEESKSVTAAAQVFLDQVCLLDELGWYQALLDALEAEGVCGLCEALKGWDFQTLESTKLHRVLLDRIEPRFTKMIKPRDLLLHLGDCLRKRECEEIQAVKNLKGPIAAAERLTDCLKRSDKQNWFKLLKSALYSCELTDALQLLEPDTGANSGVGEVQKGGEKRLREEEERGGGGGGEKSRGGEKKMREYQRELAEPVFQGKNTVICAPTGCGKTVVALAICEQHLKVKGKGAKVVFMATKVDVFNQQYKLFQEHFQEKDPDIRIDGLCGNQGDQLSMKVVMENNDIIVLTPQILVNAMAQGEVPSLSCFSLLILDECHNTTGKHPYNIIMTSYLDAKLSTEQNGQHLPQIVGLTASVGIGSFKNQSEAENNICQLCASLDSRIISTIHTNTDELQSYVHTPDKEFFLVQKRHTDPFIRIIHDIMAKIEGLAKTVYNIESLSSIENRDYGSQKYEQWIVDVQKKCRVLQLKDQEEESRVCRALYNYTEHLRKYNDALIINEDARTKDALEYLSSFIQQVKNAGHDATERQLTAYFDGRFTGTTRRRFLARSVHSSSAGQPTGLYYEASTAMALKSWMEESDSLKFLKPGVLIGRGRKSSQLTGSGMTLNSKKGVLDSFKSFDNQSKILIATSVADEGIDIPQCNLVLMYEYVGNVVKMVQVRGRGRAQGSKCILVSDKKDRIDKEKHNMEKEKIVERAIRNLQDTPTEMLRKVFQRGDKVCRDMVKMVPERPRTEGSYQLLCSKCKKHSCYTDDIRVLQDSHHIVLDPTLFSRARTEPHPKPKGFMGLVKTRKLFCHCGLDWGIVASYLTIQNLPVLKIESFVVKNCVTEQQRYYRKWRDVTFSMKTFELTDIADKCL